MTTEPMDLAEAKEDHLEQGRKAFFEDWWGHLNDAGVTGRVAKIHTHRYRTEVYTILHPRREGDLLCIEIGSCEISTQTEIVRATTYSSDGMHNYKPASLLTLANILTSFLCRPTKP